MMERQPPVNSNDSGSPTPVDNDNEPNLFEGLVDFDEVPLRVENLSGEKDFKGPSQSRQVDPAAEGDRSNEQGQQSKGVTPPTSEQPQEAVVPGSPIQETPQKAPDKVQTATAQPVAPVQPQPQQPAPQQEDFISYLSRNRAQVEKELATKHFVTTDTDLQTFEQNPKEFISGLRARMYIDILTAQSVIMRDALPNIIDARVGYLTNVNKNAGEFYQKYPHLSSPELDAPLAQIGMTIKQANPGITREQLMEKLDSVATAMGWGKPAQAQPQQAAQKQRINGFQPAMSRASAPTGTPQIPQQSDQVQGIFDMLRLDPDD